MTREEAINKINFLFTRNYIKNAPDSYVKALEMAIKALEQQDVLDKIRKEIEKQEKWLMDAGYNAYNVDIAFDAIKSVFAGREGKE